MNRQGNPKRLMQLIALAAMSVGLLAPASALADSTVGVPNLEGASVSASGVMAPPTSAYSVRSSGWRDNTPDFYASETGFLTEVSVAHWNTSDVTVKILIFRRGSGDTLSVVSSPMTTVLPATDAPGVVRTLPVTTSIQIAAGDRIGLTVLAGESTLHALNDNSSMVAAPGIFPAPAPATEPGAGSTYDFTPGDANGPLIRGRVSAAPGGGQARTTPLASGPSPGCCLKGKGGKVAVLIGCSDPSSQDRCVGHAIIEAFLGGASSAAAKPLGSAPYDIPHGATQKVSIRLTKAARSKLAKKGKLSAFLVLREQIGGQAVSSGTPITIKGAKKKKKKKKKQ